jgi:hypothetical protein
MKKKYQQYPVELKFSNNFISKQSERRPKTKKVTLNYIDRAEESTFVNCFQFSSTISYMKRIDISTIAPMITTLGFVNQARVKQEFLNLFR